MINELITPLNIKAICTAIGCSFAIGLERQIFGKPAGIRTSILICLGAYCFVALSASLIGDSTDSSRVVGQIVTGIGFLGAGIMFNNGEIVQGITSASVIWIIAAVGCLIGFGYFGAAIGITVITIFVLLGISFLEHRFKKLGQGNDKE
ncbi:MAG: putative Mg2+ transporter-C (MgtC) family protein [Glaciecola sp.]|jgi:putative Mg2+ transporter-C (MgtC) family protein